MYTYLLIHSPREPHESKDGTSADARHEGHKTGQEEQRLDKKIYMKGEETRYGSHSKPDLAQITLAYWQLATQRNARFFT